MHPVFLGCWRHVLFQDLADDLCRHVSFAGVCGTRTSLPCKSSHGSSLGRHAPQTMTLMHCPWRLIGMSQCAMSIWKQSYSPETRQKGGKVILVLWHEAIFLFGKLNSPIKLYGAVHNSKWRAKAQIQHLISPRIESRDLPRLHPNMLAESGVFPQIANLYTYFKF